MTGSPSVFIVDDDPGLRRSLCWLVESAGLAARIYARAREFLDDYDPAHPGCLVLDCRMPGMSGLDLQRELAARNAEIPIIFMTAYGEVPTAVRAMKEGALEFLEKPFTDHEFLRCIRAALEEDRRRRERRANKAEAERRLGVLSRREREVFDLVASGKANKEIAAALGLSVKTVERHRSRMMKKLDVDSVPDVVRLALQAASERFP